MRNCAFIESSPENRKCLLCPWNNYGTGFGHIPFLPSFHSGISAMSIHLASVLRALLGIALLSCLDAVIKIMSAVFPTAQNVAMRFGVGTLLIIAVMIATRSGWPSWETVRANAVRSILAVINSLSFFYALSELPLAETLVLTFLAPIFIALLSVPLLRERLDGRIVAALIIGFIGLGIVVFGQIEGGEKARSLSGIVAALVAAISYAASLVLLRSRAQKDKLIHIVFMMHLGPAVMVAPLAYGVWVTPMPTDLLWVLLMGCLGLSGHYLIASAYKYVQAAKLAPLEYTAMIWGVLFGYAIFDEVPTIYTFAGGVLIIAGAFISSRR